MQGIGKKSLFILSGSYTSEGNIGLSTFGESQDKDQFRKDMGLLWNASTIKAGLSGYPDSYFDGGEVGPFKFVSFNHVGTLAGGGELARIDFAYNNYENKAFEVLAEIGQANESNNPIEQINARKRFRRQIVNQEHYSYVAGGQGKNGIMDDFYTNLAGHSLVNYPVINTEKTFEDFTFKIGTPFSKKEAASFSQFTKPNYIDYSCDYVFSDVGYES
ncbi:MAG TPA: hypothetical protein DCM40_37405, partial [Maribacter sp.]|nr:hypothetical protein [Maribacter sp.]